MNEFGRGFGVKIWGATCPEYTGGVDREILDVLLYDLCPFYRGYEYELVRMARLYNRGFSEILFVLRVSKTGEPAEVLLPRKDVEAWLDKDYAHIWRIGFHSGHNPHDPRAVRWRKIRAAVKEIAVESNPRAQRHDLRIEPGGE